MKPASQLKSLRNAAYLCRWLSCCCLLLLGLMTASAQDMVSKEYQIKAAYLYNFAKFVEWPAQSFPAQNSPLVIGVYGPNPFGKELEAIAKDHQINGRPIVVKAVEKASDLADVHLLFIGAPEDYNLPQILDGLKQASILTVGETDKFMASGGMIDFVREADKVRFAVDAAAAEQHGLKISAQLLKLATAVHKNIATQP